MSWTSKKPGAVTLVTLSHSILIVPMSSVESSWRDLAMGFTSPTMRLPLRRTTTSTFAALAGAAAASSRRTATSVRTATRRRTAGDECRHAAGRLQTERDSRGTRGPAHENRRAGIGPGNVMRRPGDRGLPSPSAVNVSRLTGDRRRLIEKAGTLPGRARAFRPATASSRRCTRRTSSSRRRPW